MLPRYVLATQNLHVSAKKDKSPNNFNAAYNSHLLFPLKSPYVQISIELKLSWKNKSFQHIMLKKITTCTINKQCIHFKQPYYYYYGQWSPSATFSRCQDMPHPTDTQLGQSKLQYCRPREWNSLLLHLRRGMNFAHFNRQLKTFLFGSQSITVHCDCLPIFVL